MERTDLEHGPAAILIEDRTEDLHKIHQGTLDINSLLTHLYGLQSIQQDTLDRIDLNIGRTGDYIQDAHTTLRKVY